MTNEKSPLEAANEAQAPTQHFFGQVFINAWYCALVKGQGKVPYDPALHTRRATAIDLTIVPLSTSGATFNIERSLIAESREWAGVILPSLHALGTTPQAINEKWVHAEMVPAGSYTDKNGEAKSKTMPKILAVYQTEQEAEAAANAFFGTQTYTEQQDAPTNNAELKVAEQFLPLLVNQAGGDVARLDAILKGNQLVSKYFDISHPEVLKLLKKEEIPF